MYRSWLHVLCGLRDLLVCCPNRLLNIITHLHHAPHSPCHYLKHWWPGPWFNIKMPSYQYRKSHCGDKTVVRSSYLHNGISYTGKTTSLYRKIDSNQIFLFKELHLKNSENFQIFHQRANGLTHRGVPNTPAILWPLISRHLWRASLPD